MRANALTTVHRYAAIRQGPAAEYIDLMTLSDSPDHARGLADREDTRNRMAIRRGEMKAHLRVSLVEVREVNTKIDSGGTRDDRT